MHEFTFITYAASSVIALFVGFLTGVFGVGGGFLMAPALMILLGIPGNIAVGTDLATILGNSSFGLLRRRGTGTVDYKLGLVLAIGGFIGVTIGVLIVERIKKLPPLVIMGREHAAIQYILMCLFFVLMVVIVSLLVFDLRRTGDKSIEKRIGLFARIKIPPYIRFGSLEVPSLSLIPVLLLGCAIGVLAGLLGIGGGVVMLPAMVYLIGQRTTKAVGTSLFFVWLSSFVGVIEHMIYGNIKLMLLLAMLIGGIIGTHFGTYVGLKLTGPKIRRYFVYVVILAIGMVGFKLYTMTFGGT